MSAVTSYITFGKDRYHQHQEMEKWCHENIGYGSWTWTTPESWEDMNNKIWVMHSTFGHTTFAFREAKHLAWFTLRWA